MNQLVNVLVKRAGVLSLCFNTQTLAKPFSVRFLYAKTTLGIDGYLQQRERTQQQLANISDKFREKMTEYSSGDSTNMIFTEDLKNMIHLAENTDVDLVKNMMKKFNNQNQELRFGSFVFGPVVMRLFHYLNCHDAALQCFLDPKLSGFFDQIMTYQILLDLLFENGKYTDMLKVYDVIKERQLNGKLYPRNVVVLTLAACYKMNTPESLNAALKIWKDINDYGQSPMRRAATFIAGLCIAQGKPDVALEIASSCNNQNYTTIRNIKAVALSQLGRTEDVIPILKSVFNQDDYTNNKHTFNCDVMEIIDPIMEKETNQDIKLEYQHIKKQMVQQELISKTSLNDQLSSEISTPAFVLAQRGANNNQNNRFDNRKDNYNRRDTGRFNKYQNQDRPNNNRYNRPGLNDLQ